MENLFVDKSWMEQLDESVESVAQVMVGPTPLLDASCHSDLPMRVDASSSSPQV